MGEVRTEVRSLRREMLSHFDEICLRLDRLEIEYQAMSAAVSRLEKAFAEDRLDRAELRRELEEIKVRVAELQKKIARLEAESHDA